MGRMLKVGVSLPPSIIDAIARGLNVAAGETRSQYIRLALLERFERQGIPVGVENGPVWETGDAPASKRAIAVSKTYSPGARRRAI